MITRQLGATILAFIIVACGEGQNPNALFIAEGQKEAVDHLHTQAQTAYDRGDYEKAKTFALQAYEANPESEASSVLLGYIYLSLAGVDTFQLAKNMIKMNTKSASPTPSPSASSTASSCSSTASTDAASALSGLSCIIGMDSSELTNLVLDGNKTTVSGTEISGDSSNALFKSYPIKLPKSASNARLSASKTISNIATALKYICPFINDAAKVTTDSRHTAANCPPSSVTRQLTGKAHFLWSIGHLTEAIAFNSIVLYTPTGSSSPSLLSRGTALNSKSIAVNDFITALAEFSKVVDVIMPTDSTDSMLTAMFNDLDATVKGFGQIPGIPSSVVSNLETSINNLKKSTEKITSAKSDSEKNAAALKTQLTGAVAKQLDEKITSVASTLDATKKAEVCAAYASITSGVASACK